MACGSLSQRNGEPTKASRPWDIVLHPTQSFTWLQLCFSYYKISFMSSGSECELDSSLLIDFVHYSSI